MFMRQLIPETIEHATFIAAPPETVFDAIATSDGLDAWFTTGATYHI